MTTNLPVLCNDDLNRAKNKKASDEAIPFVYETIITWGCQKTQDESFLDYYHGRPEKLWNDSRIEWKKELERDLEVRFKNWPEENKKKEKERCMEKLKKEKLKKLSVKENWTQEEEDLLKHTNCEGFDVTFLHKLVPTICDGIGRYDPNAPSSTEIEKFLREVKNIRNDICHDPKGASVSGTILDGLEESAINVFKAAGDLYASTLDKQTVLKKIDELKKMLQMIKEEVMTDKQLRILQTAKKLSADGRVEMHAAVKQQDTEYLPLSDDKVSRSDVFHSVDLLIKNDHGDALKNAGNNNNSSQEIKIMVPCHELLGIFEGSHILCEGQPGSGKTTLLKALRQDFGAKDKEKFRGLRKFDLLLYMECRNNFISTVDQLLEHYFPKTLQQLNMEDAVKALRELKLLVCVDGLDEWTSKTRSLYEELTSKFGHSGNATFIFTSRPGQARFLSISYQTVTLMPLTEENQQITFLQRYQASIRGLNGSDLVSAFQSLNETCKAVLCHPVNLALFCFLFKKAPKTVKNWRNELNLMNDFLELSKQTMIGRMGSTQLENPECYADDVTDAVIDLSLCILHQQKMTIDVKTYKTMCRNIFGQAKVPYYSLMSSFFTKHPDQQTFEFYHRSNIEFLAAKALVKSFLANPTNGVFGSIAMIVTERRGWIHDFHGIAASSSDLKVENDVCASRFENVFRFTAMMLEEGGHPKQGALKRFLGEVCPALVQDQVGFSYWVELTLSCPDSKDVAEAAAEAAITVSDGEWRVVSAREFKAASRMLRYHQPTKLFVWPQRSEKNCDALRNLLEIVRQFYMGKFALDLRESYYLFSENDAVVSCLESARCQLIRFRCCLSGSNDRAWRVLVEGCRRAYQAREETPFAISLLDPRQHQLGQLEGTAFERTVKTLLPSNPCGRRPLPPGSDLLVELRPGVKGGAPSGEETMVARAAAEGVTPVGEETTPALPAAGGDAAPGGEKEELTLAAAEGGTPEGEETTSALPVAGSDSAPDSKKAKLTLTAAGVRKTEEMLAQAEALIEDLAPRNMRYNALCLLHYRGPDGALNTMVTRLTASGVRADHSPYNCGVCINHYGTPHWEEMRRGRDGICLACWETNHRPGERCVQLVLHGL